jgi:hypothetical protein
MVQVIFFRASGNETVVHIVLESVVIPGVQGGKDVVYESLHHSWAVCGAKGNDSGGIESLCSFKC